MMSVHLFFLILVNKLNVLSDEDLDGFSEEINLLKDENEKLKIQIEQLKKADDDNKEKLNALAYKTKLDNEGNVEKFQILQKTIDDYSKKIGNYYQINCTLENTIIELKNENTKELKEENEKLKSDYEVIL